MLFYFTLASLSHACKLQENWTLNLSHQASNLATLGTVIHLEKGCSESWESHCQSTTSPRSMNMCPVPFGTNSMQTQVGHLVFLKTSVSREHSILKISTMRLLAQSDRVFSFRTDFTIHEIVISIIHQPSIFFQSRLRMFSSFGTGRSYLCCRLCQMCERCC